MAATRAAYKAMGKDPARYRPAAEALLRRVAQGKTLFRASNVVEVNNLLSLETGFSIGVYNLATLTPPLVFRRGRASEICTGIGRGSLKLQGLPVIVEPGHLARALLAAHCSGRVVAGGLVDSAADATR